MRYSLVCDFDYLAQGEFHLLRGGVGKTGHGFTHGQKWQSEVGNTNVIEFLRFGLLFGRLVGCSLLESACLPVAFNAEELKKHARIKKARLDYRIQL